MKIGEGNFAAFDLSAKGLNLQRIKIKLISENIANSETTNTKDGKPYQRKFLVINGIEPKDFSSQLQMQRQITLETTEPEHFRAIDENPVETDDVQANYKIAVDNSPGEYVYMPGHPDADKNGYVKMPNVNIINEMVDMITATRAYEANLTALKSSKQIIKKSLEI